MSRPRSNSLPAFEMSADVLATFRQFDAVEVPLSDAVERTDHVVEGQGAGAGAPT